MCGTITEQTFLSLLMLLWGPPTSCLKGNTTLSLLFQGSAGARGLILEEARVLHLPNALQRSWRHHSTPEAMGKRSAGHS